MAITIKQNDDEVVILNLPFHMIGIARDAGGTFKRSNKSWNLPPLSCCYKKFIAALTQNGLELSIDDQTDFGDDEPETLGTDYILEPYAVQHDRLKKLAERSANYIGWRMGVGKSKLIVDYVANSDRANSTVILCPKSVVPVWQNEFAKHWPLDTSPEVCAPTGGSVPSRLASLKRANQFAVAHGRKFVAVLNYEASLAKAVTEWLIGQKWDLCVADEAHRLKQHNGKTSKMIAKLRDRSSKRVALSGTPIPNTYIDAFAQYRFLDPSIFGQSITQFRNRYCIMGGYKNKQIIGYKNQDELHEKLHSILHIVRLEDVIDMPPYVDQVVDVELSTEARKIYDQFADELVVAIEHVAGEYRARNLYDGTTISPSMMVASNALVKFLRMQQITSGKIPITSADGIDTKSVVVDTSKRDALSEWIGAIHKDDAVVVFCRFVSDLHNVAEVAGELKRPFAELSGRRDDVHGVWKPERGAVCAVQIQSGNAGIDLSASSYGMFYSTGFDLAVYDQARSRLYRKGQKRSVLFGHMCAKNTIDKYVYRTLDKKRRLIEAILATGEPANYDTEIVSDVAKHFLIDRSKK